MTKQNDLLEKSNFLLPKDFIGKVKRGYEIATNPKKMDMKHLIVKR